MRGVRRGLGGTSWVGRYVGAGWVDKLVGGGGVRWGGGYVGGVRWGGGGGVDMRSWSKKLFLCTFLENYYIFAAPALKCSFEFCRKLQKLESLKIDYVV